MWLMNRHPGQSVTYQQIGLFSKPLSYPCIYADIDENAEGSEEENSPNNIYNNFYNSFFFNIIFTDKIVYISNNISSIYLYLNLFTVLLPSFAYNIYKRFHK